MEKVVSEELFYPDHKVTVPKIELEAIAANGFGWNLERMRLKNGPLDVIIKGVHTPRIQLGLTTYTNGLFVRGDFPKKSVLLMHAVRKVHIVYRDRKLDDSDIILSPAGDEVDFIMQEPDDIYTVAVEKSLFEEMFMETFGEKELAVSYRAERLQLKAERKRHFERLMDDWIFQLQEGLLQLKGISYDVVEKVLLRELFECLGIAGEPRRPKCSAVDRARDVLEASLQTNVTIPEIAQALEIGKRQLYGAFKERYGISPKKYLQMLRLNAIHKQLCAADGRLVCVSDVALQYGFFHMGHFAAEYKKVFAQSPSETLFKLPPWQTGPIV